MIGRRAFGRGLIAALVGVGVLASSVSAAGGLSWSGPVAISPYATQTVGCASSSLCVAGGYTGRVELWRGGAWSAPADVDGTNNITGVSCAAPSFCAVVDSNGTVVTFDAGSWSKPDDIDGANNLFGVSCVSKSFCVAVGAGGDAFTWNGRAWSAADDIDGANGLYSVSCTSTSFCTAVDAADALTWNGSTWSAPVKIDAGGNLGWVSCASPTFCVAVEDYGNGTTIWNGHTWSATVDIDPPSGTFTNRLSGVSCASASFCVAVTELGQAITWDGSSWSQPLTIVASGSDLDSFNDPVSCPTASFCAVVGAYPSSFAVTFAHQVPVLARSVLAAVVSGTVTVEPPGGSAFAPLSGSTPIAVGSIVDATSGRVQLTAAARAGTSVGQFYAGEFKLTQAKDGLTKLALTGGKPCAGAAKAAAHKKPHEQQSLWGHASGHFETVGTGAAAIVIDPRWLTQDTCTGTTIRVTQGRVRVIDFARHRQVVVRAGHSYHAR